MDYFKKLLKSKTFWAGVSQVIAGVGLYFTGEQSLNELFLGASGVAMILFRAFSHDSIGDK